MYMKFKNQSVRNLVKVRVNGISNINFKNLQKCSKFKSICIALKKFMVGTNFYKLCRA